MDHLKRFEALRTGLIYGGTGEPTSTLKIAPAALEKLNSIVCSFD